MGREKGKREEWTGYDMAELEETYKIYPFHIPERLVERHGKWGCYTKAERMGLSHKLDGSPFDFGSWSDATKAYLAGIVDGEGTICIIRNKHYRAINKSVGYSTRPVVTISNTAYSLLKYLKSLNIGGFSYDIRKRKEEHKQAFQWALTSHLRVYGFLKEILPYLVIKKEKAVEVMDFIKQKHPNEVH